MILENHYLAKCPECHKPSIILEWDKVGKREWGSYSSLLDAYKQGILPSYMTLKCPLCLSYCAANKINITKGAANNHSVKSILRKENS